MKSKAQSLIKQFHNKKLTLDQLNAELLAINPHMIDTRESDTYENWINAQIEQYENGITGVLSLTSSQSILYAMDDEEDDDGEDEYNDIYQM